jgi:hypothetical protein
MQCKLQIEDKPELTVFQHYALLAGLAATPKLDLPGQAQLGVALPARLAVSWAAAAAAATDRRSWPRYAVVFGKVTSRCISETHQVSVASLL